MWMVAVLTMAILFPGNVFADEIYRSVDAQGRVKYSNGPSRDADEAPAGEPAEAYAPVDAGTPAAPGAEAFSTEASLRRNALERELRATGKQLRAVDERLATLGRARMRNAGGSVATGGVAASPANVRSEEEKVLATQREQLAQRAAEVRDAVTRLREEVTARLGATPEWWVEVR